MLLFSGSAFSQQKISADQVQPIFDKLEMFGQQNHAGIVPVDQLSKKEFALFKAYNL